MGNGEYSNQREKRNDRYLPCLFQRLLDNEPDQKKDSRVMISTLEDLKRSVFHNLEMLLNSRSHIPAAELPEETRDSVLGYGMFDFSGLVYQGDIVKRLQEEIAAQIRSFEPRIDPETLKVEPIEDQKHNCGEIPFRISGEIRMNPPAAEIQVISRIRLDSSTAELYTGNGK